MCPVVSGAMAALPKVEQSSTLKGSNKRIVFLLVRGVASSSIFHAEV